MMMLHRLAALRPLVLTGRTGRESVAFPNRVFLAPMEGVTDRAFRSVVLDLGGVGGASTEFLRISVNALPARVFLRELGPQRADVPVGVQLMAAGPEFLAETIAHAERAHPAFIDLNFGCPVQRVCGKGAGAALLEDPDQVARIVATAVSATELPVTAKIRAGVSDDRMLADVLHACAESGATLITLHARRRVDSYASHANWEWISFAVELLARDHPGVKLVGNGGIDRAEDVHRMVSETGCDGVMVGRAAIANPFLFRECAGRPSPGPTEAAAFVLRYLEAIQPDAGSRYRLGRIKQLLRYYRAGGLFDGCEHERERLLRTKSASELYRWFERFLEVTV